MGVDINQVQVAYVKYIYYLTYFDLSTREIWFSRVHYFSLACFSDIQFDNRDS